jgi:WD40-like Beta Propeller Repeat
MRDLPVRLLRGCGAAAIAVGLGAASLAVADTNAASPRPFRVPVGDILVVNRLGRLLVVDARGKLVRSLPRTLLMRGPQSIELAADRRHAFVSVLNSEQPARLYDVDLATGRKRQIANAISPSLSPDKTRLAYVSTRVRAEIVYRASLVVRDLRNRRVHAIPLGPGVPLGTPPELVINWSPDGRSVAVFDGSRIRIVKVVSAADVPSQPGVPGDTPSTGTHTAWLAPVFLNAHTLVVLADCCIGPQQLLAVDLRSGATTPFAGLSSPAENIRRVRAGLLLTVTALNELALVSRGRARVIAHGITAAAR